MRSFVVGTVAFGLSLLPACSLVGLDRFDYPGCPQSACERFNLRDGIDSETACVLWQCVEATGACRLLPRDEDGDTRPALSCGGDDCDDTAATTLPGAMERCNGVDDDCDGWIDDVSDVPEGAVPVLAASEPDWVSYSPSASGLWTAYDSGEGAGLEAITGSLPITTPAEPLTHASTTTPFALATSAIGSGCAVTTRTPHPLAVCTVDGDCPTAQFCWDTRGGDRICDSRLLAMPPAGVCNSDAECDDGVFCNGTEECQPGAPESDSFGCRAMVEPACATGELCGEAERACAVVGSTLAACDVEDLSVAPVGDEWLSASITNVPCARGTLRLGYFVDAARSPAARFPLRQLTSRGDARGARSTSWLGVELGDGTACAGVARGPGAPTGASSPSLAALAASPSDGRRRPQGLVAYLAAPSCRGDGSCGGSPPPGGSGPVAVELVGAWLEQGSAGGTDVGWVEGSAPLRPGTLASASTRRPAIVSWVAGSSAGYVVAFGADGGGLSLQQLDALDDPAPVCGTPMTAPCIVDAAPYPTFLEMSTRRTPVTLSAPTEATLVAGEAIVGDVAAAVGFTSPTRVEVAFSWATESAVVVLRATLDPATGVLTAGTPERFASADAQQISVTHVGSGLVRAGASIDGTLVDASMLGGFVVMWRDGDGVRAVRLSDFDSSVVAPGVVRVSSAAAWPRAFTDAAGELLGLAHQAGSWVVLPSVCGM